MIIWKQCKKPNRKHESENVRLELSAMFLELSVPVRGRRPQMPTLRSFIENRAIEGRLL